MVQPHLTSPHLNLNPPPKLPPPPTKQLYEMNETLLQHFPGPQDKIYSLLDSMRRFIARRVRSNAQSLEPSNPRDFIDCFLLQMDKVALGGGHRLLCAPLLRPARPALHTHPTFCSCSPALLHAARISLLTNWSFLLCLLLLQPRFVCMHRFSCTL